MIGNIATVRHLDRLIKKTTRIVRLILNYDVKMEGRSPVRGPLWPRGFQKV